jgi:hypothetical protein
MVFFGEPRTRPAGRARENPPLLVVPLILLAVLSVLGGVLNLPDSHAFTNWLGHTLGEIEAGSFNFLIAGITTLLALAAIGLAYYLYGPKYQEQHKLPAARRPVDPPAYLGPGSSPACSEKEDEFAATDPAPMERAACTSVPGVEERFWHIGLHDTGLGRASADYALAQPVDSG